MRKIGILLLSLALILASCGVMSGMTSATGTVTDTGAVGILPAISGSIIPFMTYEGDVGQDLNGDGYKDDRVIRYYNVSDGSMTNTSAVGWSPSISGSIIAFSTWEEELGQDLNGDGDEDDHVIRYYDMSTDLVENTGAEGMKPSVGGSIIAFHTLETDLGQDLNGDGYIKTDTAVIRYYDLSSPSPVSTGVLLTPPPPVQTTPDYRPSRGFGVSVGGSIIAFHHKRWIEYYDISSGLVVDLGAKGVEPSVGGSIIAFSTWEEDLGQDLNGDGDTEDVVIRYYDMSTDLVENTGAVGWSPSISGSIIAFQTCTCPSSTIGYINIPEAPTIEGISELVDSFMADGSMDNEGIAEGLKEQLEQTQAMIDRGNTVAAANMLQALIDRMEAQSGKHVTTEAAQTLINSARAVIDSL